MIRMYDSKNKVRVSYAYDSFYSQRYYLPYSLVPTGTVYDVLSMSACVFNNFYILEASITERVETQFKVYRENMC